MAFWQRRTLVAAYNRWVEYVAELQHMRECMATALRNWENQKRRRALLSWLDWKDDRRRTRRLMRKALNRFYYAEMYRAFDGFREIIAHKRKMRARAVAVWRNRELVACFDAWVAYVDARRELHDAASMLQCLYRGRKGRERYAHEREVMEWAALRIQMIWRGHKGVVTLAQHKRHQALRRWMVGEKERNAMAIADEESTTFNVWSRAASVLQRIRRGQLGRRFVVECRQAKTLAIKIEAQRKKEALLEAAEKAAEERNMLKIMLEMSAEQIQAVVRSKLARLLVARMRYERFLNRQATICQTCYRAMWGRRAVAAKRRVNHLR